VISTYLSSKDRKEGKVDLRNWIVSEDYNDAIRWRKDLKVKVDDFRYMSLYDGLIYDPEITYTDGGNWVYDASASGGAYMEGGVNAEYKCPCCDERIAIDLDRGEVWTGDVQCVWADDFRWQPHYHHGVLLSVKVKIIPSDWTQTRTIMANYVRS
jgi:hypothetical protein